MRETIQIRACLSFSRLGCMNYWAGLYKERDQRITASRDNLRTQKWTKCAGRHWSGEKITTNLATQTCSSENTTSRVLDIEAQEGQLSNPVVL